MGFIRGTTSDGQMKMSALGQKQTFAVQKGMSALPPKADISFNRDGAVTSAVAAPRASPGRVETPPQGVTRLDFAKIWIIEFSIKIVAPVRHVFSR